MSFRLLEPKIFDVGQRQGFFNLYGRWHGPELVMEDRARLLKAMRARAQEDVVDAKKRIAGEVASARADIERDTPTLAREIAQAVLRESSGGPSSGAGRGGAAR